MDKQIKSPIEITEERVQLKPCPCGKTPTSLYITDDTCGGKWARVAGFCRVEELRRKKHQDEEYPISYTKGIRKGSIYSQCTKGE